MAYHLFVVRVHVMSTVLGLVLTSAGCASQLSQSRAENERLAQTIAELRANKRRTDGRIMALEDELLRSQKNKSGKVASRPSSSASSSSTADAAPKLNVVVVEPDEPPARDSDLGYRLADSEDSDENGWVVAPGSPNVVVPEDALRSRRVAAAPAPQVASDNTPSPPAAVRRAHARAALPSLGRRPIGEPPPATEPRIGPVAEALVQAAYKEAVASLRQGKHDAAIDGLRVLVKKYPGHSLADNAQYWVGEAHYDRKDFAGALAEFRTVIDRYPDGNKVPDAMLKLGYSYAALGQLDKARFSLEQLIAIYPQSDPAQLARERLEQMRR